MKAVEVSHTGGPAVLEYKVVSEPEPKPNEALVQIKATGLNFIDVYFREGRYPSKLPFIVGQEAAGVVERVGNEVTMLKPGDRVAYTGLQGAYAEKAVVAADRLVKIPEGVSFEQAAALMLQGMTAHYLVKSTYPLKSGETCLIHAAAGGVGQLLVQMAKMIGAMVVATAGTDEKCDIARRAGADHVINYEKQDFEEETKRLTTGKGVHVVYDGVGKATFEKGLNVLLPRGYMVLFGGAFVGFLVAPAITLVVGSLHRHSRARFGALGEAFFLLVLGALVFWLYYRVYIFGPASILPSAWQNPKGH